MFSYNLNSRFTQSLALLILSYIVEFNRVRFFDLINLFVAKNTFVFENICQNSCFIDQKKIVFVFHDRDSFVSIEVFHDLFVRSRS